MYAIKHMSSRAPCPIWFLSDASLQYYCSTAVLAIPSLCLCLCLYMYMCWPFRVRKHFLNKKRTKKREGPCSMYTCTSTSMHLLCALILTPPTVAKSGLKKSKLSRSFTPSLSTNLRVIDCHLLRLLHVHVHSWQELIPKCSSLRQPLTHSLIASDTRVYMVTFFLKKLTLWLPL